LIRLVGAPRNRLLRFVRYEAHECVFDQSIERWQAGWNGHARTAEEDDIRIFMGAAQLVGDEFHHFRNWLGLGNDMEPAGMAQARGNTYMR